MQNIEPLTIDELADELKPLAERYLAGSGFIPNSFMVMARMPTFVAAYNALRDTTHEGTVPAYLRLLMFHISSVSSGCRYCQAHSFNNAAKHVGGAISQDKLDALWEFETSPLYDDAERAALRFAQASGAVPNAVTPEDYENLRQHYSELEIVQMVAGLAWGAFLNRLNETLAVELEDVPREFVEQALGPKGWDVGRHAA